MIQLILLKHPESSIEDAESSSYLDDDDNILTSAGRDSASRFADALAGDQSPIRIFTSPRERCVETARIIAERVKVDYLVQEELSERHRPAHDELTIAQYRHWQESSFLNPFTAALDEESPVSHRLRVEGWLSRLLSEREDGTTYVVVSHGSVIEHLNSSLDWKPAGAMSATFSLCEPGNVHCWTAMDIAGQLVWCRTGSNLDYSALSPQRRTEQQEALIGLATSLVIAAQSGPPADDSGALRSSATSPNMKYYIR